MRTDWIEGEEFCGASDILKFSRNSFDCIVGKITVKCTTHIQKLKLDNLIVDDSRTPWGNGYYWSEQKASCDSP